MKALTTADQIESRWWTIEDLSEVMTQSRCKCVTLMNVLSTHSTTLIRFF